MTLGFLDGQPLFCTYDVQSRLATANGDEFAYDVDGYRVSTTLNGVTRRYVYDTLAPTPRLIAEYDDAGVLIARYVYGHGLISRQDAVGGVSVHHYDVRGSTVALTGLDGTVTDRYAYGPYGRVLAREGDTPNPFLYCGRYGVMDDGNGLNHMRLRYYAPALMRFIQKDQAYRGEASLSQTLNRHIYGLGNPITNIDPNGDSIIDVIVAVGNVITDLINGDPVSWEGVTASLAALTWSSAVYAILPLPLAFLVDEVGSLVIGNGLEFILTGGESSWSWKYSTVGGFADANYDIYEIQQCRPTTPRTPSTISGPGARTSRAD